MRPQVSRERGVLGKCLWTDCASVRFFASVGTDVGFQLAARSKRCEALVALVRPLYRVSSQVPAQVLVLLEGLGTVRALVRFIDRVISRVNCQVVVRTKRCGTERTLERRSFCVHPLVSRESAPVEEGPEAERALERSASKACQVIDLFTRVSGDEAAEAAPELVLFADHWALGVPLNRLSVAMLGGHDELNG